MSATVHSKREPIYGLAPDLTKIEEGQPPATQTATGADVRSTAESAAADVMVAIAASSGGLLPLVQVLEALPDATAAAVVVAVHTGAGANLVSFLQKRCVLPVRLAHSGDTVCGGVVYVAPPLHHVVVNADRTLTVADRARVRFARPSADWLFHSLAASYGDNAIAVVLSGYQRDGARGVVSVHQAGGMVIAQDPDSCEAGDMPTAAIGTGSVTSVLRPELIPAAIANRIAHLDLAGGRFEDPFAVTA